MVFVFPTVQLSPSGTKGIWMPRARGAVALRRDRERVGRSHPVHFLLNDFSKLIEASGYKHSCLLQGLVLGYCSFRSLVGTSSSMAKLDLESREQQLYLACYSSRNKQRVLRNICTGYRLACAECLTWS